MCTGFEYALLALTTASTGSAVHAANTAPKPPPQRQASKEPVIRNRKTNTRGMAGGNGAGGNPLSLLNVGSPTLLGS